MPPIVKHSQYYDQNKNTGPSADTTSGSRKSQRGGWRTSSNKADMGSPGKASEGWRCNTNKATGVAGYGPGGGEKRTSTNKSESGSGWKTSTSKKGR